MRKTRLVLIPGVKSLAGACLLLFLACPTIAFKGQENREVDTICKSQNLKDFWVESPWPGDKDNIGWVRGYGGGTWPGNSQKQTTCNALLPRFVVRSSKSEGRRVQARRELSRDDGTETRKIRLDNDVRKDVRREVKNRHSDGMRHFRDSRRVAGGMISDEERRMDSRIVREDRRASRASTRSLDRKIRYEKGVRELDSRRDSFARHGSEIRTRSVERRAVTTREVIDGNQNSRAPTRNVDREIRSKREVREPGKSQTVFTRERSDAATYAERRTFRNREVIDGRRDSGRSLDNRSDRQIRNIESRQASLTQERANSRVSNEQVRSVERRNVENRRVDEPTHTRLATRFLEREIRIDRENRELVSQQDSRFRERVDQRIPEERFRAAERRVMNTRNVVQGRTDSAFSIKSLTREGSLERSLESRRTALNRQRTQSTLDEPRFVERRVVDSRRALGDDMSESRLQNQRRDARGERETRKLNSQIRDRMVSNKRIRTAERQTINDREIINGRKISTRSLDREMQKEVRDPEGNRATGNQRRLVHFRLNEESRIENRRERENRRESRLSTQSLDRQIRSNRKAREMENRRLTQETDSRRTNNFRSADEQRIDNRRESRENRQSSLSVERVNESIDAQCDERNVINEMRNRQESPQTHLKRCAAMNTRQSRRTTEEERRADNQRERDSRYSRSLESVRSAEKRRVDKRRFSTEKRDSRLSVQSLERAVRSEREISDRRAAQVIRESKMEVADAARSTDYRTADSRRDSRILVQSLNRQRSVSGQENLNRKAKMDSRHTEVEQETRITESASPGRVSRRSVDVENPGARLVSEERLRRSTRSVEAMRQSEMRVRRADSGRESLERESRREMERKIMRERRNLDRFSRTTDERQNELRQVSNQYMRSQRLSRSLDDVRRFDRQTRRAQAERETRLMRHRIGERRARHPERASPERISRWVTNDERIDTSFVRENIRSQLPTSCTRREVRAVGDISSDRLAQRADARQENRNVHSRRNEVGRETRTTNTVTPERLSRLAADAARADTRRVRDDTRSQIRLLREARSVGDVRQFDRETPFAQKRRETTRSRRGEVENLSRILDRASHERVNRRLAGPERADRIIREIRSANERRAVTERESLRLDRPEVDHENGQQRLTSADFRRIDIRNSRDAEIRRISKGVSLKLESTRSFPKEARRSDRQRRIADVEKYLSHNVDKRRDTTFTTESIRRLTEFTEFTNKPRRSDIRERYDGKTNAMEREYGQELSNKGKDNVFESSKNALASWLTTDISRTDLNGIAETLMYGGIACLALFSNVNKKVIF